MAIDATAASFETSKFATPHPGEVAANQSEHVALNNANFLGFLTPLIIANRVDYGRMWMQGVTNKYAYEAGSVPLQTVPPLPPPPPSTTGGAGSGTPGLDQAAGEAGAPLDSFFQQMTGMLPAIGQMPMSAVQSLGSGGPLKTLTEVPSQLLSQMGSLASAANLSPEAGLDGFAASDWVTSTPLAGGAVNASLAGGGGGGGLGGAGTISAASALRSPGSWASAVSAAAPATGESTSRFNEVRAQSSTVPASAGGGMGGAMAPLAHGAAGGAQNNNDEKKTQTEPGQVLVSAADLFRSSDAMPVITGGGGLTRAFEPGDKEAPV